MSKSKLLHLFLSLETSDWRALTDFVKSPYYNKKEVLVRLFSLFKKYNAKGHLEKLFTDKQQLFRAISPNQPFKESVINHWLSDLYNLVETFISVRKLEKDGIAKEAYVLEYYLEKNLDKHYSYLFDKTQKKINTPQNEDHHWFYQKLRLSDIADQYFHSKKIRRFDSNLQDASNYLDAYYLTRKLDYLCQMLDRQKFFNKNYDLFMLEEVLSHLKENSYEEYPVITAYYYLLQTLMETAHVDDSFYRFKNFLLKERLSVENKIEKSLYYFGINVCIRQFGMGNKSFASDLMDFYQQGIEKEVLLEDGFISPWTFKNVVKLGLGLNQLDWTKSFIDKYHNLLPPEYHSDVVNYNLAEVYYYQGDSNAAMDYLNKTKFTDFHYNLHSKLLLTKIFWEKEELEALDSLLTSFYAYLKRHQEIPKNDKIPYYNFIQIMQLLKKQKVNNQIIDLKGKINSTKILTSKNWLMRQIQKIED